MSRQMGIALLAVVALCLSTCVTQGQESYGPIRVFIPVTGGLEGGSLSKLMQDVIKVMEKESGYKFDYSEATYSMGDDDAKLVADAFKAGKADITYIRSIELIRREEEWNGVFKPGFVMIFNASNHQEECFYVLEDSGMNTVEDLRGKRWGGSRTYVPSLLLHDSGIDEPLTEFFGEMKFFEDAPPAKSIKALRDGFIDVVAVNKHHLVIGGAGVVAENDDKEKSNLKYKTITCTPGELNWIFAFNKDVPDEVVHKITKIFVNAHKDKAFRQFQFIFLAIKGGFGRVKEKDWDRTKEIAALIDKFGWDKEQEEFDKARSVKE